MILPDGEEIDIKRRGIPSIIEQKKVIQRASDLDVDCLVAEIMSIHPENHFVESQAILKPHLVVLTNIRSDHIDALGNTEEEIGAVFGLDIPSEATLCVLEKECTPSVQLAVKKAGGNIIKIREGVSKPLLASDPSLSKKEFLDNIDLIYGVANYLKISKDKILNGIHKVRKDIGAFRIWKYTAPTIPKTFFLVNGFAANDPDSTLLLIQKLRGMASSRLVGLLNLRSDRGDRTLQWIDALKHDLGNDFEKVFVIGGHAGFVNRELKSSHVIKEKHPEKIMETIFPELEDQTCILGFGNMEGAGRCLIDYWNKIGDVYGI